MEEGLMQLIPFLKESKIIEVAIKNGNGNWAIAEWLFFTDKDDRLDSKWAAEVRFLSDNSISEVSLDQIRPQQPIFGVGDLVRFDFERKPDEERMMMMKKKKNSNSITQQRPHHVRWGRGRILMVKDNVFTVILRKGIGQKTELMQFLSYQLRSVPVVSLKQLWEVEYLKDYVWCDAQVLEFDKTQVSLQIKGGDTVSCLHHSSSLRPKKKWIGNQWNVQYFGSNPHQEGHFKWLSAKVKEIQKNGDLMLEEEQEEEEEEEEEEQQVAAAAGLPPKSFKIHFSSQTLRFQPHTHKEWIFW